MMDGRSLMFWLVESDFSNVALFSGFVSVSVGGCGNWTVIPLESVFWGRLCPDVNDYDELSSSNNYFPAVLLTL